jgi:1-acyl-sn-glycerol-3-phosphate acyltransferase
MTDSYHSIRHYNQDEAKIAIQRLFTNRKFLTAIKFLEHYINIENLIDELEHLYTVDQFQLSIAKPFIDFFLDNASDGITYSGLDNIRKDENYLFIANHRDIVFDTALLQYYFMTNQYPTTKIAIGDNLLSTPLLREIGKVNKMVTVKRSVTLRERLENYHLLSEYIHFSILEEHESVWIAQRNGRTKDGIDQTQPGLLKMLAMTNAKDPLLSLKELKIVPVTISYEYEVCDQLKARELALSEIECYKKKPGEDFDSIKKGLFGHKGRINFVIGKPIISEFDSIPANLSTKEKISEVCKLIDSQIYANYKLFPNHFIAFDQLENSSEFINHYSPEQEKLFLRYLGTKSIVKDVPREKMMNYLLQIYSNPVKTTFGKVKHNLEDKNW